MVESKAEKAQQNLHINCYDICRNKSHTVGDPT